MEADITLISRPCPWPRLVQPSRLPTSIKATTLEVPGRKDESTGSARLMVLGFRRKKECRGGNTIAFNLYELARSLNI